MRGTGYAPCHHGEILQGAFREADGSVCRGLVTLPMRTLGTRAEFVRLPGTTSDELEVLPADRTKAAKAARLAVAECARHRPCGGRLRLHSEVPIGLGMGSSTSDIIAAVHAVAASFGTRLRPADVARLAVRAECASDPLMLEHRPLLFAQREARVLEILGEALPRALVVGCITGGGRPVDTLALSATYGPAEVEAFEGLRTALRKAIASADLALLGQVSTESARHNQRVLAKEEFPVLAEVAATSGAAGVQIAHSGNVAGLLFDPDAPRLWPRVRGCVRALRANGITVTRVFSSSGGRECTSTSPTRSPSRNWCTPETAWSACGSRR
ncbi:GHMP kinase [Amycolatopsis cihanbeyliensis]|uniref:Threonine kinase n=1 Tax=Amycolatopsis cihanbeyliensis TaxID=1128664 RepID=A0A542DS32_AMYCI|nr:GHMP kinase [Amycolatopsis cihanbeyliensis]TQJ05794.1 threonine kinase [Amycolatopsis cihanbeyliensis]